MTTPTPAASRAATPVMVQGNTVYLLNDLGCNRWTVQVQPGRDDSDSRVSDAECNEVAQRIADALNAPAAQPASPAPLTAAPSVPEEVLILIHKYGDARADDAGSAIAIGELVLGLRRWAAALASPQVAPAQRNTMRAFEAWYCSDGNYEPEELDKLTGGACYANADTENMWQAWQGAFLHVAAPAPVGPQDDARDAALWRKHVAKLDALVIYCPTCCQGSYASKDMTRDEIIFECGKTVGRSTPAAKPTEEQGS